MSVGLVHFRIFCRYLTICSRLFGTEQYEEAIEVAVKGALRLLSLHSGKAGAKLAMQVLDFFKATKQPISDTNIGAR
ncbi:hypothetical protein BVRB_040560 [Beta vulgaris subsp. vulgaris]|uniref:Uncharacterized protein n=1 Tax=Beta vulgaris subsp. vulgaris TaxID=3555 RepID=A0A0J7YN32_BETVV|nr:hypothetical protein BVRB_040560 [Beta vulgaris subsp. vulgaris]